MVKFLTCSQISTNGDSDDIKNSDDSGSTNDLDNHDVPSDTTATGRDNDIYALSMPRLSLVYASLLSLRSDDDNTTSSLLPSCPPLPSPVHVSVAVAIKL